MVNTNLTTKEAATIIHEVTDILVPCEIGLLTIRVLQQVRNICDHIDTYSDQMQWVIKDNAGAWQTLVAEIDSSKTKLNQGLAAGCIFMRLLPMISVIWPIPQERLASAVTDALAIIKKSRSRKIKLLVKKLVTNKWEG